jgi:ABC-type phosphate/phosphonate transport system ATPase subunit
MLRLEGVTKRFGAKAAVDNVSLEIPSGQFVGVIGRSGAGKSTLLRMINRLAAPTSGRIIFDGVDITKLSGQPLRDWRQKTAMIFQQFNLVGRLDVLTNVMDALLRINKHFGITVLCNLHSIDTARSYSDRLIGMTEGRLVFDGAPAALTDAAARELYGLEAGDVMHTSGTATPAPISEALAAAAAR